MISNPVIHILQKISKKASKVLHRDYFELENIQSSPKGPYAYANKSYDIVLDILATELSKAYPEYSILTDEKEILNNQKSEYRFLINPLDGQHNLARANPFFAFSITLEKLDREKFEPVVTLINSAFFGFTYFAAKGQGSWLEKIERGVATGSRIRVATNNSKSNSYFSINQVRKDDADNQKLIEKIENLNADIRILGSDLMCGAMLASGKFDAAFFQKPKPANLSAVKLMIAEAGGITFPIKSGIEDSFISCSAAQYKDLFKYFNS